MDSLSAFDDLYTAIDACLIYPDEVIDRFARAFYPAILSCWNSEEGQRSLVGARPLHLANARPFCRLKAPPGLSLLHFAAQTRTTLFCSAQNPASFGVKLAYGAIFAGNPSKEKA